MTVSADSLAFGVLAKCATFWTWKEAFSRCSFRILGGLESDRPYSLRGAVEMPIRKLLLPAHEMTVVP